MYTKEVKNESESEELLSREIILAILANAAEKGKIEYDTIRLHKAFHKLKENSQYKDLLKDLYFRFNPPFSKKLQKIIFILESSGKIEFIYPKYEEMIINGEEDLNRIYEKLSPEEIEKIEKVAEELRILLLKGE